MLAQSFDAKMSQRKQQPQRKRLTHLVLKWATYGKLPKLPQQLPGIWAFYDLLALEGASIQMAMATEARWRSASTQALPQYPSACPGCTEREPPTPACQSNTHLSLILPPSPQRLLPLRCPCHNNRSDSPAYRRPEERMEARLSAFPRRSLALQMILAASLNKWKPPIERSALSGQSEQSVGSAWSQLEMGAAAALASATNMAQDAATRTDGVGTARKWDPQSPGSRMWRPLYAADAMHDCRRGGLANYLLPVPCCPPDRVGLPIKTHQHGQLPLPFLEEKHQDLRS